MRPGGDDGGGEADLTLADQDPAAGRDEHQEERPEQLREEPAPFELRVVPVRREPNSSASRCRMRCSDSSMESARSAGACQPGRRFENDTARVERGSPSVCVGRQAGLILEGGSVVNLVKVLPMAFVMIAGPQLLSSIFLTTSENWPRSSATYVAGAACRYPDRHDRVLRGLGCVRRRGVARWSIQLQMGTLP